MVFDDIEWMVKDDFSLNINELDGSMMWNIMYKNIYPEEMVYY